MDYYEFYESIRFSLPWTSLKYKYENNISSNEFLFYQLLDDEVSCLALSFGLNHKLSSTLARVHSFTFCDYGIAGWHIIEEVLKENKIDVSINQIKIDITKKRINCVHKKPDNEFYDFIDELYNENSKIEEVKLVRECHRILKTLQPIKNCDLNYFYKLEKQALDELKENYMKSKEIAKIDLSKYLLDNIPLLNTNLDSKIRLELKNNLQNDIQDYKAKYPNNSSYENILIAISCFIDN